MEAVNFARIETLLAAESLEIWILDPGLGDVLLAQVIKLLEDEKPGHQSDGLGRAPILLGLLGVVLQLFDDPVRKPFHLRHGLDLTMVFKPGRVGPEDLADRVPAQVEVPGYLSDRFLVSAMGQLDLAYRLHRQHLLVPLKSFSRTTFEGLAARNT